MGCSGLYPCITPTLVIRFQAEFNPNTAINNIVRTTRGFLSRYELSNETVAAKKS